MGTQSFRRPGRSNGLNHPHHPMPLTFWLPAVLCVALAGCGGGGGSSAATGGGGGGNRLTQTNTSGNNSSGQSSSTATLVISPSTVTVSASTVDPAPTATIQLSIDVSQGGGTYYIGGSIAGSGIASTSTTEGVSVVNLDLAFESPASLGAGTYKGTVTIDGCYDQACTHQVADSPQSIPVTYTVTLGPTQISSIKPSSAAAGGSGFTLQVDGSGFTTQSTVDWGGTPRSTRYVSPTELTAQINSSDIAVAGLYAVTVAGSAANRAPSSPATFLSSGVFPTTVTAGGPAFFLTVLGEGFTSSSVVQWSGSVRTTTFISPTEIRAQIKAQDIAAAGVASVTVQNVQGGNPTSANVTVAPQSKDAVAFQINPQHSGAITFSSVILPTSSAWSVDVGGTPSYALIAGGKVFVTSSLSGAGTGGQSQLIALDQATGTTAWGPIALSGEINAAYGDGIVFVTQTVIGGGAKLLAYDGASGTLKWTAAFPEETMLSPPVASNGLVFAEGDSTSMTAIVADTGATDWTKSGVMGDALTPTVTADGIYWGGDGVTDDLDPATGELLWQNAPSYSNSHDAVAAAANGMLYSPNTVESGSFTGTEFDAESATVVGGFDAYYPSAIGTSIGYFLSGSTAQGGRLSAVDLATGAVLWTFTGDGQLHSAPILVNQYVFIGSASGTLYALNAATGAVVWQQSLGGGIPAGPGWGPVPPYSGLAAGDGLLVVPAGTKVIAYTLSTNP